MSELPAMTLTVLGTTDLHGHVLNWDYAAGAAYADERGNHVGLAKCATIIRQERAERPPGSCLTLDAGDILQGTPLAHHFAQTDPVTCGAEHPMAAAMNAIGFDAAALGNHEFNYGLGVLRAFERQLDFPLLGANAVEWSGSRPAFTPWMVRTVTPPGAPTLRVGILGLVTPGVAVWDRAHVQGRIRFEGIVEQARVMVPHLKQAGADVVVVACHSGADSSSCSYGALLPHPENASTLLAQQVPDIDAILVGHAHVEIPERIVTHHETGRPVLLSEPLCWGMRVSIMELDLRHDGASWQVVGHRARLRHARTVGEDERVVAAVSAAHKSVRSVLGEVVASSAQDMPSGCARYRPSDVIDFVNHVQAQVLRRALAGTEHARLPVLSVTSPYSRTARVPRGPVTVADLAGVYIHESTLMGVLVDGAGLLAYLEHSAAYFRPVLEPRVVDADALTGAPTPESPQGVPDFGYDVLGGLDAAVSYDIDLAAPVGERIARMALGGRPIRPDDRFALAVNSYRQAGGSHYPVIGEAPVIYDEGDQVRGLLVDWARETGRIDSRDFGGSRWRLTVRGEPLRVLDGVSRPAPPVRPRP